jgi:arsenate reductase
MPSDSRPRLQLYGIRSCDSCRRALQWLQSNEVPHAFHDVREEGLRGDLLQGWLESPHGRVLLNRRSTTWRQLPQEMQGLADRDPVGLLLQYPTLMKRPVITDGQVIVAVGFDPASLEASL